MDAPSQVAPEWPFGEDTAPPNMFAIPWVENASADPLQLVSEIRDVLAEKDAQIAKHIPIIRDMLAKRNAQVAEHLHVNMSADIDPMIIMQQTESRNGQFAQLQALLTKSENQRAEMDIRLEGLEELRKALDEIEQGSGGSIQSLDRAEQAAKMAERDELTAQLEIRTKELTTLISQSKESSAELKARVEEVMTQLSHRHELIEKQVQIVLILKKFQGWVSCARCGMGSNRL